MNLLIVFKNAEALYEQGSQVRRYFDEFTQAAAPASGITCRNKKDDLTHEFEGEGDKLCAYLFERFADRASFWVDKGVSKDRFHPPIRIIEIDMTRLAP